MSILDIAILLMLIFGLWQGFQAGLMRSVVSLFGWLIALVFATYFAKPLSIFFVGLVDSPVLTVVISFLAIALFIIVVLQFILWLMRKSLAGINLSIVDKLGGAVFAVAKNLLIILLVLSLVAPMIQKTETWQQSTIAQELLPFAPFAKDISKNMATKVEKTTTENLDKLDKLSKNTKTVQ